MSDLVQRLIEEIPRCAGLRWQAQKLLREAADRIEALEKCAAGDKAFIESYQRRIEADADAATEAQMKLLARIDALEAALRKIASAKPHYDGIWQGGDAYLLTDIARRALEGKL